MTNSITWRPVVSSNIESIAYDGESNVLFIEFKDGDRYEYQDVAFGTFNDMINAPSVGKFFHARIRDKYPTTKMS